MFVSIDEKTRKIVSSQKIEDQVPEGEKLFEAVDELLECPFLTEIRVKEDSMNKPILYVEDFEFDKENIDRYFGYLKNLCEDFLREKNMVKVDEQYIYITDDVRETIQLMSSLALDKYPVTFGEKSVFVNLREFQQLKKETLYNRLVCLKYRNMYESRLTKLLKDTSNIKPLLAKDSRDILGETDPELAEACNELLYIVE